MRLGVPTRRGDSRPQERVASPGTVERRDQGRVAAGSRIPPDESWTGLVVAKERPGRSRLTSVASADC